MTVPGMLSSNRAVCSSPGEAQSATSPAPTKTAAAGGDATVTVAVPLTPSHVAVMVADPALWPVTSPLVLTVATVWLPLDQTTARPDREFPWASFGVAVSWTDPPTLIV